MQIINSNHLSSIAGGAISRTWNSNRINSFANAGVLALSNTSFLQVIKSNIGNADSATDCCRPNCRHLFAPPKNGDRNAMGQIYSWGTWWDDTH